MTIREMQATFGKLDSKTLLLSEGLNIIEGANESGKSTWCAFIRAMFYGINTSERDTKTSLAVKNRYRPWNGMPMSGVMRINTPKYGEITLERRSTSAAPMRDLLVYNVSGDKIMFSESSLGEELLGIGKECFERSVFIETLQFPSGGTGELERRIMSLVSSGDENSSYTEAVSTLQDWRRRLQYRNSGKIPELENRINKLRSDLETSLKERSEFKMIHDKITKLEKEKNNLHDKLAEHQESFQESQQQRIWLAEERLKSAELALIEASERLPAGTPKPTANELRNLELRFYTEIENKRITDARDALLREKQRRIDQIRNQLSSYKPFAGCSSEQAKEVTAKDIETLETLSTKRIAKDIFIKRTPLLFIPLVLSVLILLLSPDKFQGIPSWIASGLLLVGSAATLVFISRSKAKKRILAIRESVLDKYDAKDTSEIGHILNSYLELIVEYKEMEEDIDTNRQTPFPHISDDIDYIIERIKDIFPYFNNAVEIENGLRHAVQSALASIDRYERALIERNTSQEILNALKEGGISSSDKISPYFSHLPDEMAIQLENIENELSVLRRQAALLEGRLSQIRQPSELESEIKLLQSRLDKLNQNHSAISLAIDTLSDAYKQLRERFSPRLNSETAKIFASLTSNKYNRVIITREFEAMAEDSSNVGLRRALELSRGTMDQLYLAMRLAICRIVLPSSFNLPLILDDALISFDNERMAAALEWLYNESKERQILLFTCHKREGVYLRDRAGVNILTI